MLGSRTHHQTGTWHHNEPTLQGVWHLINQVQITAQFDSWKWTCTVSSIYTFASAWEI